MLESFNRNPPVSCLLCWTLSAVCFRRIPEGTGWVIDGYPQNYNQAKLLEKALSGYDVNAKENQKLAIKSKTRKSSLVPDPRPAPPPIDPASGIDIVILFNLEDEVCLKRASGRSCACTSHGFFFFLFLHRF